MARKPEGPPPPPTVQRLRVRYAKRGRLRFTSHRDFQRALERALRRARVPMAYSAGFTPHPKVSYANAAPTGVASEAEYLEIGLAEARDPEELRVALDAALPAGLDVLEVVQAGPGSLADRLEASVWRIELAGVEPRAAAAALAAFLAAGEVEVTRMTKNGLRTFDARAAVLDARIGGGGTGPAETPDAVLDPSLVGGGPGPAETPDAVLDPSLVGGGPGPAETPDAVLDPRVGGGGTGPAETPDAVLDPTVAGGGTGPGARIAAGGAGHAGEPCAILRVVVRHGTPAVRPDDVLAGLARVAGLTPPQSPRVTRLAQGPLSGDLAEVHDPLAPDRPDPGFAGGPVPDQASAHAG